MFVYRPFRFSLSPVPRSTNGLFDKFIKHTFGCRIMSGFNSIREQRIYVWGAQKGNLATPLLLHDMILWS